MKKIFLFIFTSLIWQINAQNFKILFIDDDNYGLEYSPIITALDNSAYDYEVVHTTDSVPSYAYIQKFDIILWYTGNDGTTSLWTGNGTTAQYIQPLIDFATNGGILWVDGIDYIYDVCNTAPDDFAPGSFIYDKLGISRYAAQSKADDGGSGVAFYLKDNANPIPNMPDSVKWQYSTLYYADALEITSTSTSLYQMEDGSYPLAGYTTSLINNVGHGTYISTGFRLGKLDRQSRIDSIIDAINDYAANNLDTEFVSISPIDTQNIITGDNGIPIYVHQSVGWDSLEWKYATTEGGPYYSFSTPQKNKSSYTPNFATEGTYYIVCEVHYGSQTLISNEVVVNAYNLSVSISPPDNQYLLPNTYGTTLVVSETPQADSREWKYSTTPGGPYQSFSPPQTQTSYTPYFSNLGIYYVICESTFGSTTLQSNEVKIYVETDFKILFVNDDNYGDEYTPIDTALSRTGYTYYKVNTEDSIPSLPYLNHFDLVLWYTGNDGTTNIWNASDTSFIDQIQQYVANGGKFWLDGIDFIYDMYGPAPEDFSPGDFVYDKLGINNYLSQSYADDGNQGVPMFLKTNKNKIFTENPITWQYSSLWYTDGYKITNNAVPLYIFGDENYNLYGQTSCLYTQDNFGTYLTTQFRLGVLGNGNNFVQDSVDKIINDVINYIQQPAQIYCQNIENTTYYVSNDSSTTIRIPFSVNGGFNFNSNNVFTAYLSDGNGDFSNEIPIGSLNAYFNDTIIATIPAGTTTANGYRIRIKSSQPQLTSNPNGQDLTIILVNISISPVDTQHLFVSQPGTELTVNEPIEPDYREWKFATNPGGPYQQFSPQQTANTYTPLFDITGTFYVICEEQFGDITVRSNEVVCIVEEPLTIQTGQIDGSPFIINNENGAAVNVPYSITGNFNDDNIFTAYLSDKNGDFTNEMPIGSLETNQEGIIQAEIPPGTPSGDHYRIRVKSSSPQITGNDNDTDLKIILDTTTFIIQKQKINIYPNPTTNYLIIEHKTPVYVEIYNSNGSLILQKYLKGNSLNISKLTNGIYTITINTLDETVSYKFIKK